jgi:hypothetical protein
MPIRERPLDRDRVRLDEQRWCSGSSRQVDARAPRHVAGERRAHIWPSARRDVGGHRDHAVAAQQHQRERVSSLPL